MDQQQLKEDFEKLIASISEKVLTTEVHKTISSIQYTIIDTANDINNAVNKVSKEANAIKRNSDTFINNHSILLSNLSDIQKKNEEASESQINQLEKILKLLDEKYDKIYEQNRKLQASFTWTLIIGILVLIFLAYYFYNLQVQ
jgi:hypothetical protein